MPSYTPPAFFTATNTFAAVSLTSLSTLMVLFPNQYHKHVLRSSSPSTADLFVATQFTKSTQYVLHDSIRTSGILLLGSSAGLLLTRKSSSSFTLATTLTASVAAAHLYLLRDLISNKILRRAWLQETERVVKMGVIVGVNALTAGITLWASLSYGGWPWKEDAYFSPPPVSIPGPSGGFKAGDIDFEGVIGGVVKNAVEVAGGLGNVLKGFLSSSS